MAESDDTYTYSKGSTVKVNYNVGSSTAVTLPSVTGYKWKLTTWGYYAASSTSSPFTEEQATATYAGEQALNDVYGELAFDIYANEHDVTCTIEQTRGDGTEGSGNSVTITKQQGGSGDYIETDKMAQYTDNVKLTFTPADGYYLADFTTTATDVTFSAGTNERSFTMPDDDVPVTVTFKEMQYTIVYDKNSANGTEIASQTKYHLSDFVVSSVVPEKAGYTFLGWSKTNDASATTAEYKPGALVEAANLNGSTNDESISLFAVWRANDYHVTIDPSICGGTVSARGTAQAGDDVELTIEMDEGYTALNELYYTDDNGNQTAIDQGTRKFTMPAGNVTVFASFRGSYSLTLDGTSVSGGQLLIGKTVLGTAEVGRKVKLSVKAEPSKKLKHISYQKVTTATGVTRAPADIDIEGVNTIQAADPRVEYFSQQGVYVATIDGVDSNLRVTAQFEDKQQLTADMVQLYGVSPTYPAGDAPDQSGWYVTVNSEAQETGVDVTLATTMSNNYEVGSKGTITVTATANNKDYQGSVTFSDKFEMVKVASANYTIDAIPSVEYSGSAQTPTVTVRNNGTEMTVSDGDITYSNNTNAGTATVQVKISDDEGYVTQTFLINRKDLTVMPTAAKTLTYGQDLTASPSDVTAASLASGDQLTAITFSAPSTSAGTYTMTVSGAVVKSGDGTQYRTDNYNLIYQTGTLTISPAAATLTPGDLTLTYGDAVPSQEDYSVTASGLQYSDFLASKPDMSTTYTQGGAVGSYTITSGTNPTVKAGETDVTTNYTFTGGTSTLTVKAFDLRDAYIAVSDNEKGYNGSAQTATVKVYTAEGGYDITNDCDVWYGDASLKKVGSDTEKQTVALSQVERGAYPITVKPKSGNTNVTGQKEADESFVIGLKSITSESDGAYDVSMSGPAKTYTGSAIEPTLDELTVVYSGSTLTSDQKAAEFEITGYSDNVNAGTGKVSMVSRNVNFSGIRDDVEFAIQKADLSQTGTIVTGSTAYAATVRTVETGGKAVRNVAPSGNSIALPYQGTAFQLQPEDVLVWLSGGTNALPAADYKIRYKKDGTTYDTIDDIGTFTVVIAAGTSGNTENEGETSLTVVTQREIVVTENQWVTYYDGKYDLEVPTGYKAYYVSSVTDNTVEATELTYIPSDVPVLLYRESGSYSDDLVTLTASAGAGTKPTDASEQYKGIGTDGEAYAAESGSTDYIIVKSLFVKAEPNSTVEEHRCYLRIANSAASGVRSYSIVIGGDNGTTGLNEELRMKNEESTDRWYDLQGNRIAKPTRKGVYIKNGVKTVIK